MTDWPPDKQTAIDQLTAFDAMRAFLEAWWERGERSSDDVAWLLSAMNRGLTSDGGPVDAAMWSDWLDALQLARRRDPETLTDPLRTDWGNGQTH